VGARVRYRRTCRIRSERLHGGADLRPLDVAEDLVPVLDRLEVVERRVEEGAELVLVAAGDDGRDYLVEVEVREERRLVAELVLAVREEDALERPRPGRLRLRMFGLDVGARERRHGIHRWCSVEAISPGGQFRRASSPLRRCTPACRLQTWAPAGRWHTLAVEGDGARRQPPARADGVYQPTDGR
jgi:hypothetical protein